MTCATLDAVVFDLDGTLAETERDGHRVAFNAAFAAHQLQLYWDIDRYGDLLTITCGRRRILAGLQERGICHDDLEGLAARVHRVKTDLFAREVRRGRIGPRPGVRDLVRDLRRSGVRVAVATTGTRAWAEPLIEHLLGPGTAEVTVFGDDVTELTPHAEAYRLALDRLGIRAGRAVAVEDSGPGLRAAVAAGLATVVVTNDYTREHCLDGAALVRADFDEPTPLTTSALVSLLQGAGRVA
ncbi:HAD-IA family hydrolase [Pseudonocardia sp. KRD-291]|nr:HAD-IA family hydrolase [Pseudonocardia sp. KRD291]